MTSDAAQQATNSRGKLVILAIFAVALAMAGYSWWHQRQVGRRTLELWGTESAWLIRHAGDAAHRGGTVEMLQLVPVDDEAGDDETLLDDGFRVTDRRDITRTRGLVHARHMLIQDASYQWDAEPSGDPQWDFALRFREREQETTLLFDVQRKLVRQLPSGETVVMTSMIDNLAQYLNDVAVGDE